MHKPPLTNEPSLGLRVPSPSLEGCLLPPTTAAPRNASGSTLVRIPETSVGLSPSRLPFHDRVRLKVGVPGVGHERRPLPGHPVLLVAVLVDVDQLLQGRALQTNP